MERGWRFRAAEQALRLRGEKWLPSRRPYLARGRCCYLHGRTNDLRQSDKRDGTNGPESKDGAGRMGGTGRIGVAGTIKVTLRGLTTKVTLGTNDQAYMRCRALPLRPLCPCVLGVIFDTKTKKAGCCQPASALAVFREPGRGSPGDTRCIPRRRPALQRPAGRSGNSDVS